MPTDIDQNTARLAVERFVRRFGNESYRMLVYHAALPLVLTPELLNYLRNTFLRGLAPRLPWVAEVDLLLSDLCEEVGYEQYAMRAPIRGYLMAEMREKLGGQRMQDVARLLLRHVRQLRRARPGLDCRELQAQELAAMVCLEDQREAAAREIATHIRDQVEAAHAELASADQAELARLTQLTQSLAPQLSAYPELVRYAQECQELLTGGGQGASAAEARRRQGETQVLDIRLPPLTRLLRDVKAAVQEAAPPPMQTEEDARKLRTGLRACESLLSDELLKVEPLREAVEAYRGRLAETRRQVGRLTDFKKVHDRLHHIQIQCYNLLVEQIRGFPKERVGWELLQDIEQNLENIVNDVDEVAKDDAIGEADRQRIAQLVRTLTRAHAVLKDAVARRDEQQLKRARFFLDRALSTEPPNISHAMAQIAQQETLGLLGGAAGTVADLCSRYPTDPGLLRQVREGIGALQRLAAQLRERVQNHDQWQRFDVVLQRTEDELEHNHLENFAWSWADLKDMALLLAAGVAEPWAAALATQAGRVDAALAAVGPGASPADPTTEAAVQAFQGYRGRARQRFYQVDVDLLKLCTKIARALGIH
jgi:hypothetical protein